MKIFSRDIKGSVLGSKKSQSSLKTNVESIESGKFFIEELVDSQKNRDDSERKDLHELLSALEIAGNELTQNSRLNDFYSYRKLVKSILQKTFPNTFFLENILDKPSFRKPIAKEHKVVQLVNQELNSLFNMIKSGHKNTLEITSKVLEIRGLLFDVIT